MRKNVFFYIQLRSYIICVNGGGGGGVSVFIADMFALQEFDRPTCICVNSIVLFMTFDIHR